MKANKVSNELYSSREVEKTQISDIKSFAASKLGTIFGTPGTSEHFIKIQEQILLNQTAEEK